MGESHETHPGEITPQNHIEKIYIYILHKENGAYFRTILFSQELSIFFRITGKIFDIYFLFFAVVIKSDSDIEQYFDYYSIKPI